MVRNAIARFRVGLAKCMGSRRSKDEGELPIYMGLDDTESESGLQVSSRSCPFILIKGNSDKSPFRSLHVGLGEREVKLTLCKEVDNGRSLLRLGMSEVEEEPGSLMG